MKINTLHYITTNAAAAELACQGGVRWVQLRVKNQPPAIWKQLALDTQAVCRRYGATVLINDNPRLAQEIGAEGVHVGKADMPAAEAREMLGSKFIIGGTANTFADVQRLAEAGVDYVGLGPFRFTPTKENLSPILGLSGYTEILRQCQAAGLTVPIIGIGGITLADVEALATTGLHGVAVSSAIGKASNPAETAGLFVKELAAVNPI
ncbi:thiamine phosphate synthase [Hymenobacter sp. BT770]|uniref:thiamine phosphate synthase n=1 Tax=Hymenobacter sp. BT770 TaxID=2886942 RepID=UPI001D12A19B|nr:thiamine phosphate synthase [Hymenobacter sp. BT770]MCC3151772.1 thiamine phosphate synthase [Hymenobacter sp. BT770]MDO3413606.1 thiamine phosphate synthase [Hymenobacter sp. BT770]